MKPPQNSEPTVLFEDNHILALVKPFGYPSQGDETGDDSVFDWAKRYLKKKYEKAGNVYLALLHRLDRPVGGIILLGKTSKAAARLTEQFKEKSIKKTYYAVVETAPAEPQATLCHYLRKLPGKNIVRAYSTPQKDAQEAILSYQIRALKGERALLAVKPLTGRQHQIRAQLAAINAVIVGDVKYGKTDFSPDKSIALFAAEIVFEHPTRKETITLKARPPRTWVWNDFRF